MSKNKYLPLLLLLSFTQPSRSATAGKKPIANQAPETSEIDLDEIVKFQDKKYSYLSEEFREIILRHKEILPQYDFSLRFNEIYEKLKEASESDGSTDQQEAFIEQKEIVCALTSIIPNYQS